MSLERFLKAQKGIYETALNEIKNGRKRSHWMWYVFPQIKGLGSSSTANYYAIQDKQEAEDYLKHPVLFKRLMEISEELLKLDSNDAGEVFGYPDDMKLKSSMTLFLLIDGQEVFEKVLDKFFDGEIDERTVEILENDCNNVIAFPDFEKLKNEVEKMRTELSMLLLERDELQFVICKNIETEYMLKLGSIEYKAYEVQCAALRLKRKIELIQAKKNRQEKVIISSIEETLDNEFAEYQKHLDEQIDKMNDALRRSKAEVLSDEENKELKKLYRKIVKALHPDINLDVSEAQVQLFNNAVLAYKNGDLGTLKIISEMVGNNPLPEQHKDAMTQLVEEQKRLQGLLKSIRESIENIKSEYPYTMKDILEDTEKTEQKKQELESILEQYNELISIYERKIEEMLR